MKTISTMLVFLSAACLGGMSLKAKDCSSAMKDGIAMSTPIKQQFAQQIDASGSGSGARSGPVTGPVQGSQVALWEPVSEIEDGGIYMIRCAQNHNLVWDISGGVLNNGTQIQLYDINYTHAQKFVFKKQFNSLDGKVTYRLSPLFNYDKVLRFESDANGALLKIDDERYDSLNIYTDKISFTPYYNRQTEFFAATCFVNQAQMGHTRITAPQAACGEKIRIKDTSLPGAEEILTWELLNTDYVGLNVGNLTYINGKNESRYVARVPYTGRYVIETHNYGSVEKDTYLRLVRDSTNTQVAYNDDGGAGRNAKITYNFQYLEEYSIYLRGYSSSVKGNCYLVLRPEKTIYMSSVFDFGLNNHDYTTYVNQAKPFVRNLGYYPEVQTNLHPDNLFYGQDWEGTRKVQRDYYVHRDHGSPRSALYFDRDQRVEIRYNNLPDFTGTGVIAWIMCNGADEAHGGAGHCLARQSVINGADYSFGFRDSIYTLSGDIFVQKFFEGLQTRELEEAIIYACQAAINAHPSWTDDGIKMPSIFLNGGSTEYRYTVTETSYTRTTINY